MLKPEFTKIKIAPNQPILLYTSERCSTCDTLISSLNKGTYKYKSLNLTNNTEKEAALEKYIPGIDTITSPIFNVGGHIYTDIKSYDQLLEKLLDKKQ